MAEEAGHAFVTGGGTGIGAKSAILLSRAGLNVSVAGRRFAPLERTAGMLSGPAHAVSVDVTDEAAVAEAVDEARSKFGPIDRLVNCAGAVETAPFRRSDNALVRRMLAVNVEGAFAVTRAVLPDMVAADFGRIVTVASTAGLTGYSYVSAYCASKHAVIGMTRALALELAKTGVTVNAVCPGYTDTDMVLDSVARLVDRTGRPAEEIVSEMLRGNPQDRLLQPEEVADAVVWLCGRGATAITGQAIAVAGGEVM